MRESIGEIDEFLVIKQNVSYQIFLVIAIVVLATDSPIFIH